MIKLSLQSLSYRDTFNDGKIDLFGIIEKAAEYRGSVNVEPCWTFKIEPQHMMTWQGFGWHRRYFHPELHDGEDNS